MSGGQEERKSQGIPLFLEVSMTVATSPLWYQLCNTTFSTFPFSTSCGSSFLLFLVSGLPHRLLSAFHLFNLL